MELEIHIDRERCIGAGQCVHLAPGVFDQAEDAKAFVLDARGGPEEHVVHAVTACPMQAITLEVGGTRIGANELRGWMQGVRSVDPLVSLLLRFSEEHHALRETLAADGAGDRASRADVVRAATSEHLHDEDEAYAAITRLIDPRLVATFDADHERIHRALDDLATSATDGVARDHVLDELVQAVEEHIRLEEAVLFPAALAALARQASAARA